MKRKTLLFLITFLACSLISVLSEIFIFNFKPLTLDESNRSITNVAYSTERTEDNRTKLVLDIENKYIRSLLIDYNVTKDTDYEIEYSYTGIYENNETEIFKDIFDNSFGVSATNIDKTVSHISIIYNDSTDLIIGNIAIDNDFHFNYFRAIFVFLFLLLVCALFSFYKNGFLTEKTHVHFAIICSLLGMMFIIAQPAMSYYCWDDQIHFDRVVNLPIETNTYSHGEYNMSNGATINSNWPQSTNSFTEHRLRSSYLDIKETTPYTGDDNSTFLSIHKIPYIPMAAGYHLAKLVGLPFTICFIIGKIFNLLFYVLLITYAIKTIVTGKRLLAIIALLPSSIFLASEYSYDPAVFAGITIFLAHLFNLLLDKKTKFDFKTALIMITSMTYACLAKAVYAPIMLLVILIPKDKFKNVKQSHLYKIGFTIITILLGGTLLLSSLDGIDVSDTRGGEVSVKDQLSLVTSHPSDYASILKNTVVDQFGFRLFSSNTLTNFSYAHKFTDQTNYYYIFIFLLLFVFLTDNINNRLTKKQRASIFAMVTFIIIIIWSALYLDFTPVGLTTINGVQNRYFLPLLLPLLLCLQSPNIQNKINPRKYNLAIFALTSIATIFMIYQQILIPYNF